MATAAQIEAALRKADAAGDTAGAKVLAGELRRIRAAVAPEATPGAPAAGRREAPPIQGGVNPAAQSDGTLTGYLGAAAENLPAAYGAGVASVLRDYGMNEREQAPADSRTSRSRARPSSGARPTVASSS